MNDWDEDEAPGFTTDVFFLSLFVHCWLDVLALEGMVENEKICINPYKSSAIV